MPSPLVNSYVGALISVSDDVGITAVFVKPEMASGIKAPKSKVAAFIGIVGGSPRCTVSLMADMVSFEAYVAAFTGGMVKADPNDSMSMSILGELTNMISGRALIHANISGLDITPPQLFSGDNMKLSPTIKSNVKSFTLPFKVDEGKIYLALSVYN
jgi:chemotaxis protein CheX